MRYFTPKPVFALIPRDTQINCGIFVRSISYDPAAEGIGFPR